MPSSYELQFFNQSHRLSSMTSSEPLEAFSLKPLQNGSYGPLYLRQNQAVSYYAYDTRQHQWEKKAYKVVFNHTGTYSSTAYPAYLADILGTDQPSLVLKTIQGISVYHYNPDSRTIELLAQDRRFHDSYRWHKPDHMLRFGRFYPNTDRVGMLARDPRNGVKFYVVNREAVQTNKSRFLRDDVPIQNPSVVQSIWRAPETDVLITDLRGRGQDDLIVRTAQGLRLYEFTEDDHNNYHLIPFLETPIGAKPQNASHEIAPLFFANLTQQPYQDILEWGASGLSLYQYHQNNRSYALFAQAAEFAQSRGWNAEYRAMLHRADLNGDQRDELILTGPQGITFLAFDPTHRQWRAASTPLTGAMQYAHVLKVLPACPPATSRPVLLVQDRGALRWAEIIEQKNTVQNLEIDEEESETLLVEGPPLPTFEIPVRANATVPALASQTNLTKKRFIRLAEQLDTSPLLQGVDTLTGQLRFALALSTLPTPGGFTLPLTIAYDSQQTIASLLGQGWSWMPPEFIAVEMSNSIYPEDHRYSLFSHGSMQPLKLKELGADRLTFEWANQTDVQISYNLRQKQWRFETQEEILFFGNALHSLASSAIQWGLAWPHWRGTGRDAAQQEPLVLAWHLNERRLKKNDYALYYHYEAVNVTIPGGKSFTEALYLKEVTDRQDIRLTYQYAPKTAREYDDLPRIDADGTIRAAPLLRRYLQKYQLQTREGQQAIQFTYRIKGAQRYLNAIEQVVEPRREPVLQFTYETVAKEAVLTSSTLPNRSTLRFTYQKTPDIALFASPTEYSVKKFPSVVTGPDYMVIGFIDAGKLMLSVLNRGGTETYALALAPLGRKGVNHYQIWPQEHFFAVALDYGTEWDLYLFHRQKGEWSWSPKTLSFSQKPLIRVSQDFAVIAEPLRQDQTNLTILEWQEESAQWKRLSLPSPPESNAKPPQRLAVYQRLIVVYDDTSLWLGYRDDRGDWQRRSLKTLPGWVSQVKETLEKLNLGSQGCEEISEVLNQQGLQILSNWIVLSTLQEQGGQLSSRIQVGLLNCSYQLVQENHYHIPQENLLQLSANLMSADGRQVLELGYQIDRDSGRIDLKVKGIPLYQNGKSLDEVVESETNNCVDKAEEECRKEGVGKGGRGKPCKGMPECQEEVEKLKKQTLEVLEANLKRNLTDAHFSYKSLVDWSRYQVTLTEQAVQCGNQKIILTGSDWQNESISETERQGNQLSIRLSQYFLLEKANESASFKLYRQNTQGTKGEPLLDLETTTPERVLVRHPIYLAYQTDSGLVQFVEFRDPKTLGQRANFSREHLYMGSPFHTLITYNKSVRAELPPAKGPELTIPGVKKNHPLPVPESFTLRSVSLPRQAFPQQIVTQVTRQEGERQRLVAYDYKCSLKKPPDGSPFYANVRTIPAADQTQSGWMETMRTYNVSSQRFDQSEAFFDAQGQKLERPVWKDPEEPQDKATNLTRLETSLQQSTIWDRSGQHIIADFEPRLLSDEEVAYYGFESYEVNVIGSPQNSTSDKQWRFKAEHLVKQGFALTGENYLHLEGNDNASVFEGVFQPKDQGTAYVAGAWVRCTQPLELNDPVPYLKALVMTESGEEILGVLSRVKYQSDDWSYLELMMDLPFIKHIYQAMVTPETNHTVTELPETATELPLETTSDDTHARLAILLRVSAASQVSVDLDHIRFSPLNHPFEANVYHPMSGQRTAVIQANGLVTHTLYNSLQQPIAWIQERGQLASLVSESKTGRLFSEPNGAIRNQPPCRLTFQPESGFYERFDAWALRSRWVIDEPQVWTRAPGQLQHRQSDWHRMEADPRILHESSAAIRCDMVLSSPSASVRWQWQGGSLQWTRQTTQSTLSLLSPTHPITITALPNQGEWILMMEQHHVWVWCDGVLLLDQKWSNETCRPWTQFTLEAQGEVVIKDVFLMNNPSVQVEYSNAWGEKTQVIRLEGTDTVQVSETLYDGLGRPAITTKNTRLVRADQPLFAYYPDFVTNDDPTQSGSVWKTGRLEGAVSPYDQGFAYWRVAYAPNPFNEKQTLGLPGSRFSTTGPYARHFSNQASVDFLTNLFPPDQGYRQQVEHHPNGRQEVRIFDVRNNQVALYWHVPGYDHQLSTYEYDDHGRLVKSLPPLYHETIRTRLKTNPWQAGDTSLSEEEQYWQKQLATTFNYDQQGRLIRKITPDSGTVEMMYNQGGQIRFMLFQDKDLNQTSQVMYYSYNDRGQLQRTGYFNTTLSQSALSPYVESTEEPADAQVYQQFYYSDDHPEPILRNRIQRRITFNDQEPFLEEFYLNDQQRVETKRILSMLVSIEKKYVTNQLREVIYPLTLDNKPFVLTYQYNKQGQLTGLGSPKDPTYYGRFTYHASGQLASEQHRPDAQDSFTRRYHYNSPGFLQQMTDPFFTEDLTYTEGGYGQAGWGDGIVMQTTFNASWLDQADPRFFLLKEDALANVLTADRSKKCVRALIQEGYLDTTGRPQKLYYPKQTNALPFFCSKGKAGYQIAQKLAERYGSHYGHRYAYGNHQELTKAKYFVGASEDTVGPLQPHTFAEEISGLSRNQSQVVWRLLHTAEYLNQGGPRAELSAAYGHPYRPFFREQALEEDLRALETNYTVYTFPLQKLLMTYFGERRALSFAEFQTLFLKWKGEDLDSSRSERVTICSVDRPTAACRIWKMLYDQRYLQEAPVYALFALEEGFRTALQEYSAFIPEIVRVLMRHFTQALGETAFDVRSYEIDANGNHGHFRTGFEPYELTYHNGTNQISEVKIGPVLTTSKPKQTFAMRHDGRGNVVQALHRGIQRIEYNPVSQRTTRIQLTDGRVLRFYYDAQGERVLKRVVKADGQVSKETYYIRDEKGRVLVDYQVTYSSDAPSDRVITAYLYGPRGLFGFIRNNCFYRVLTDHEGSIRLVIKEGRVEAAYDYLPYGQQMRAYANNPEAQITYRYTGQEWDEETGLYNYHARLYDPTIGRFYQIDPKEQYFSPYKYAGNSPVSLVDPDGEIAGLVVAAISAIAAVVGAYLGGATANNQWDPTKWNFESANTWLGIVGGGLAGGLAPFGAAGSVGFLTTTVGLSQGAAIGVTVGLGVGGAYLTTAAANRDWNPARWDWKSPGTYQGLLMGASAGSSALAGVGGLRNVYSSLSSPWGKALFAGSSTLTSAGLAYGGGVLTHQGEAAFWKWNWEDPATWAGIIEGGLAGAMAPASLHQAGRFLGSNAGKIARNMKYFGKDLKALLKYTAQNKGMSSARAQGNLLASHNLAIQRLQQSLRAGGRLLTGVGGAAALTYLTGSGVSDSWDHWDMATMATYEVILNGILSLDGMGSPRRKKGNSGNIARCRRSLSGCTILKKQLQERQQVEHMVKKVAEDFVNFLRRSFIIQTGETGVVSAIWTNGLIVAGLAGLHEKTRGALYFYRNKKGAHIVTSDKNNIGWPAVVREDKDINKKIIDFVNGRRDADKAMWEDIKQKLKAKGLNTNEINRLTNQYKGKQRTAFGQLKDKLERDDIKLKEGVIRNFLNQYQEDNKEAITNLKIILKIKDLPEDKIKVEKIETAVKNYLENIKKDIPETLRNEIESNIIAESFWKIPTEDEWKNRLREQLLKNKLSKLSEGDANTIIEEYQRTKKKPAQLKEGVVNDLEDSYWKMPTKEDWKNKLNTELLKKGLSKEEADMIIEEYWRTKEKPTSLRGKILNDDDLKGAWKKLPISGGTCEWNAVNCAEPHALTGLFKKGEITGDSRTYRDENIRYMGSYDYDEKGLKARERCTQCQVSTAYIKDVVTDPEWSMQTKMLADKLEKSAQRSKSKEVIFHVGLPFVYSKNPTSRNKREVLNLVKVQENEFKARENAAWNRTLLQSNETKPAHEHLAIQPREDGAKSIDHGDRITGIAQSYLEHYDQKTGKRDHASKKANNRIKRQISHDINDRKVTATETKSQAIGKLVQKESPHEKSIVPLKKNRFEKAWVSQESHLGKIHVQSSTNSMKPVVPHPMPKQAFFTAQHFSKNPARLLASTPHAAPLLAGRKNDTKSLFLSQSSSTSPRIAYQQHNEQGRSHHRNTYGKQLTQVTAAVDVTGTLFALNVFTRAATGRKYNPPVSRQAERQHRKAERRIEKTQAKVFGIPPTEKVGRMAR
jgi:RHS repeat-associated protein